MVLKDRKRQQRFRRCQRIRKVVKGQADLPRLRVFRSLRHVYVQAIDDRKGRTICSASDLELKNSHDCNLKIAGQVGESLAKELAKKGIKKAVFDRGGFKYHGQVKALAEGVRKGKIQF